MGQVGSSGGSGETGRPSPRRPPTHFKRKRGGSHVNGEQLSGLWRGGRGVWRPGGTGALVWPVQFATGDQGRLESGEEECLERRIM